VLWDGGWWVWRIMPNRLWLWAWPSMLKVGVENFVPAVLAVGLRKHHQLGVSGVASQIW
jgi:hypothetical protein